MSWLDEMEAADSAYPGDVSYPAARTRAGQGLYQLHAELDDGHLNAARDLIADWYARQANHKSQTGRFRTGLAAGPRPRSQRSADRSPRQHPPAARVRVTGISGSRRGVEPVISGHDKLAS